MKTALVVVLIVFIASPAWAQPRPMLLRQANVIQRAFETRALSAGDSKRPEAADDSRFSKGVSRSATADPWAKRHAVLLGALAGFGGGLVIGAATCKYPTAEGSSCRDYTFPGNARLLGGLTIGGLGAAIGASVGAIIRAR